MQAQIIKFALNQLSHGPPICAIPQRRLAKTTTTTTNSNRSNPNDDSKPKKPNLRQAAKNNNQVKVIAAVCALALLYMYPMIFKPLFGVDASGPDQTEKIDLENHRPSNMPAWKSPFGPRSN